MARGSLLTYHLVIEDNRNGKAATTACIGDVTLHGALQLGRIVDSPLSTAQRKREKRMREGGRERPAVESRIKHQGRQ